MLWSKLIHVDKGAPGVQRRCENDTSTFVHSYNILLYILISIWCKYLVHPCCSSMIQCNRVMLCWFYTIYNTSFTQEFPCIPYVSILSSVHFIIICVMHLCMYHPFLLCPLYVYAMFYHFNEHPLCAVLYAFLCFWWKSSDDLNKRLKLEINNRLHLALKYHFVNNQIVFYEFFGMRYPRECIVHPPNLSVYMT